MEDSNILPSGQSQNNFESEDSRINKTLLKVLKSTESIQKIMTDGIKYPESILKHNSYPLIYANTINVIQGQPGVYKSRVAECFCAAMLKKDEIPSSNHINLERTSKAENYTIVYVDSERNHLEQLPEAMQRIKTMAGYDVTEHPDTFQFLSLIEVARRDRFDVLREYIRMLRKNTSNRLFIILDVSTDCVEDFNAVDKSMELIDLLNVAINEHDVVFMCIIHENPGSDKPRGHLGTELANKSSTQIRLAMGKKNDFVKLSIYKNRSNAKMEPLLVQYCESSGGLIQLTGDSYKQHFLDDQIQAIIGCLSENLQESISKIELFTILKAKFDLKDRSLESKVKEIMSNRYKIGDTDQPQYLAKKTENRQVFYYLRQE